MCLKSKKIIHRLCLNNKTQKKQNSLKVQRIFNFGNQSKVNSPISPFDARNSKYINK